MGKVREKSGNLTVSPASGESITSFAGFRFDRRSGEVRSASDATKLTPRAAAVLAVLVDRAPQIVSKQELLALVWGDRIVGDEALTSSIQEARRALGDNGRRPRLIETRYRRGYRLMVPSEVEPDSTSRLPAETRYAKNGDLDIAYQVTGHGPVDVLLTPGNFSHLDLDWDEPHVVRFIERLSSFCRLIRFDKRGTGLSDRIADAPTLEERVDDLRAVMDAAGSQRAALLGFSEGGPMSILFAATYPERTSALILYGAFARQAKAADYPWGGSASEKDLAASDAAIDRNWGKGLSPGSPGLDSLESYRTW